jgi:DNA-binding transcriptional MerR regulator
MDNVIHVAFGPGGGRRSGSDRASLDGGAHASAGAGVATESRGAGREPITDVFTTREVCRLFELSPGRLRALDKAAVVSPSGMKSGRRAYTFQDLIALRATLMLSKDVKLREVARAIGALRSALPRVTRPLQELRLVSDGRRVVVRTADLSFEPVTGQLVLDFQVKSLRDDVVRVLRPEVHTTRARTAYELYARASTLDEDPATFDEAEALYGRAIELDPHLAIAYTNLGNVRFRRGDSVGAESLYRKALAIDEGQPEAHYNLGYVVLERGDPKSAVALFEKAIERDPRFADAHFNLAMALEQSSEHGRARIHWRRYLELEPNGTWSDIARQHL